MKKNTLKSEHDFLSSLDEEIKNEESKKGNNLDCDELGYFYKNSEHFLGDEFVLENTENVLVSKKDNKTGTVSELELKNNDKTDLDINKTSSFDFSNRNKVRGMSNVSFDDNRYEEDSDEDWDFKNNKDDIQNYTDDLYEEHEIIVNKEIYTDEYSGFAIFTAVPKSKRKPIYSTLNGRTQEQHLFTVKFTDKEAIYLVKKDNRLLVVGKWIEDEHYGLQFDAKDVSSILLESDKEIRSFIKKNGLKKNVTKEIANQILYEADVKEIPVKTLLEDPLLLKKIPEISKEKYLARKICFEWFHYKQAYYFGERLSKSGLKMGKANKIYTFIFYPTPKRKDGIENFQRDENAPTERFEAARELMKTKDKDFTDIDPYFYNKVFDYFMENPYRFIDIPGIGFNTIDSVALQLGIDEHDPRRIEAIITHTIQEECNKTKNTVVLAQDVLNKISNMKGLTKEDAQSIFNEYHKKRKVLTRKMDLGEGERKYITTDQLFVADFLTAKRISELSEYKDRLYINPEAIKEITDPNFNNDESQSNAVLCCYQNPVSIITGGPGSGKTTTIKKLLYIFNKYEDDKKIILLAPTGKAAKRMDEAIRKNNDSFANIRKASTIHKFLFNQENMNFENGSAKKENFDKKTKSIFKNHIFIIDESSMIDSMLMYNLIKYIGVGSRIVFVGDIDQIPPVGVGQVMRDLMTLNPNEDGSSKTDLNLNLPISKLTKIHRVGTESKIPEIAQTINKGSVPREIYEKYDFNNDFNFIDCANNLEIVENIENITEQLLNNGFKEDDIFIISPQWGGEVGVHELNKLMKWMLNPLQDREKHRENYAFKTPAKGLPPLINGDRVINNKNNYELDIFNGEIGTVADRFDNGPNNGGFMFLRPDEKPVEIDKKVEKAFNLAYAITVHKSQGSEAPVIIYPVSKSHSFTLDKFLLYTGVTRAKTKIFIIGERATFISTLKKNKQGNRLTSLRYEIEHWKEHQAVYDFLMENEDFIEVSYDEE